MLHKKLFDELTILYLVFSYTCWVQLDETGTMKTFYQH